MAMQTTALGRGETYTDTTAAMEILGTMRKLSLKNDTLCEILVHRHQTMRNTGTHTI